MQHWLRTVLALVVGVIIGGIVNMAIVMYGGALVPPPPGVDMTTPEGITAGMPLLEPRHFIPPFLAHALGTLVGALVGATIAVARRPLVAYLIGILFLAGGIAASTMIPAPAWFIVLDLAGAYIPMAWLGLALANRVRPVTAG